MTINPSPPSLKRMLKAIEEHGPMTDSAWMKAANVGDKTFRDYRAMLHANEEIHIHSYEPCSGGGHAKKVWVLGPGEDAEESPSLNARRKEKITPVPRIPAPHPITAALMGMRVTAA